jgi:hypothetical protein
VAHFAEIDDDNRVIRVIVASQEFINSGAVGDPQRWVQTSYNTVSGRHRLGGTPLRKNFAGPGYVYNAELDAFVPPCPFPSWQIDPATGHFEPPVPPPQDGQQYEWHEPTLSWQLATTQVVNQE